MFFLKELPTRQILESYRQRFPAMNVNAVDEALRLLRRASLLLRELEANFASHGLSQTRFLIMIVLDRESERPGLLPSELADKLDISRPVVTDTVHAMKAAGLLTSAAVAGDGRAKLLSLTASGRARLDAVLPGYYAIISAFMDRESADVA
jgi:DNA-binding MarR family transcriptional regulator